MREHKSTLKRILTLLLLVCYVSSQHYYIVPSDSASQCQWYRAGTCFTLSDYSFKNSQLNKSGNITLSFFPGEHKLDSRIPINGAQSIVFTSLNFSNNSLYTIKCQGKSGLEFVDIEYLSIKHLTFVGCGNVNYGGAIFIHSAKAVFIESCHFFENYATKEGGAMYVNHVESIKLEDSLFDSNYVPVSVDHSTFVGAGICVCNSILFTTETCYTNNWGGAIYALYTDIYIEHNYYVNNLASTTGGALFTIYGNIYSKDSYYINNTASRSGGAINCFFGSVFSISDHFLSNVALTGGAIMINSADGNLYVHNCNFRGNKASELGAVIFKAGGIVQLSYSNISDNFAGVTGIIYQFNGTLVIGNDVNINNNLGSTIYVSNNQLQITGRATFISNYAAYGGAITAIKSQVTFNESSKVLIYNNTAVHGGGVYLSKSVFCVFQSTELINNKAQGYGGAIFAFQTNIDFNFELEESVKSNLIQINNNSALNGGAVCAVTSIVKIANCFVIIDSNLAILNGGAMYLDQTSKIYLQKYEPDYVGTLRLNVRLDFTNNMAKRGGAVYVTENAYNGVLCQGPNSDSESVTGQMECFIQTLSFYEKYIVGSQFIFINTIFMNNSASIAGSDIYGGMLDYCAGNLKAEIAQHTNNISNGFDYIKTTTKIEDIINYSDYEMSHPDYIASIISSADVLGLISSNGYLALCSGSFNTLPFLQVKKGELFTISVVVIDQVGNLINATVSSTLSSKSGNGHFNGGQVEQKVENRCTELRYNVFSQDNSTDMQLHLFAEAPCIKDISTLTLHLYFLPCECPVGFQPSPSLTECICECDQAIEPLQAYTCFPKSGTIQLNANKWIGSTNSTNGIGYIIHDCPFDYCVEKPINISFENADEQCAYNRTGFLCGMCKNLSLVLGSTRCKDCSSYYLSLLILFAIAGIALVAFILLFNLTVAIGTIHGLIFYANVLMANYSLFLPFETSSSTFLTVFVSWLNLDLGIEVCFYNGMDSYGKFLLQLAFPTYVFTLLGIIIVLCEVSQKFAKLLGNRNPVAALCTLILLSYSKLIRTTITGLQFTYLNYPDGSSKLIWLYDANVPYFSVSHIPRFVAAFIILAIGAVYITLLLFGQWIPRCSHRRIMKWVKHPKYNAFIDAYHAPFTPKHRYWMGLLLFAITTQNIVAALTAGSTAPIISAGSTAVFLILLKLLNTRIYKNKLQDSLETLFLINIAILTVATREMDESQLILANTSIAISFVLSLGILSYHLYKYILEGTKVWASMKTLLQKVIHSCKKHRTFDALSQPEHDELENEEDDSEILLEREMETPCAYTQSGDNNTNANGIANVYAPTIIVPAVRYDQLREPDLDIIDPITTEDYTKINQPPQLARRHRQIPTTTVIDVVRPINDNNITS